MRALAIVAMLLVGGCGAADERQITVAFAGDVNTVPAVDLTDPAYEAVFAPLRRADVAMVNLESALSTGGTRADKRFVFRAEPGVIDRLGDLGVDVVTMANNHALDYGRDGLEETLDIRADSDQVDIIGVGRTAKDALRAAEVDVRGTTVTFLAAKLDDDPSADPTVDWAATATRSGVASATDPAALMSAVRRASGRGPVVVFMHWGVQLKKCPARSQTELATSLREVGADVVVGAHSHSVQPMGRVDDSFVAYGLGNFVWWWPGRDGGALTVTLTGEKATDATWQPVERTRSQPVPAAGEATSVAKPLAKDGCA